MLSGGIRYGHEWNWHLVKLVNAGGGSSGWDGSGCQWDDLNRRLGGSQTVRSSGGEPYGSQRTISVPVEMEKEPYGDGGEGGDCYQIEELRWASKK